MILSTREKVAYGCGDFAGGLIFNAVTIYLMFFYTENLGISAAAASMLLLLARFWDALIDPIMGLLADQTKSRWGKYRPFLLYAPVPLAVTAVLAYCVPDLEQAGLLWWAYITYFLLMVAYTAVNIPYASLPAVMTVNPVERAQLTSYRMIGSFSSGIVVNLVLFPLVAWFGNVTDIPENAYAFAIGTIGILCVAGFWYCFSQVRERVAAPVEVMNVRENLSVVLHSKAWWCLLALGITMFSFNIFSFYGGLYFLKYVFGDATVAPVFFTTLTVGMLVGSLLTLWLVKHIDKRRLAIVASVFSSLAAASLFWVVSDNFWLLCVLGFCSFFSVGVAAPVLWALAADIADDIKVKNGNQVVALTSSALSFSMKAGMGIGGALVGVLLTLCGFDSGQETTESVNLTITSMVSLIPAIGNLLFAMLILIFPLTQQQISVTTPVKVARI